MPVSRIATATRGSPAEYFQAVSARTPEICEQRGSPAASLASRPCASSCEQSTYRVAPTEWGTPGASFAESGLKPNEPYCSSKYVEHRGGEVSGSSASQWSKSGSFGVLTRGLSLGSVPGNAARAAAGRPVPSPLQRARRSFAWSRSPSHSEGRPRGCFLRRFLPGRPGEPLRDQHFRRGRAIRGRRPGLAKAREAVCSARESVCSAYSRINRLSTTRGSEFG